MDDLKHIKAALLLNKIPRLGPVSILRLREQAQSLDNIFAHIEQLDVADSVIAQIKARFDPSHKDYQWAETEIERCNELGIKLVSIESADYPTLLKNCTDAPPVLYVLGDVKCLSEQQLAVVGARKSSRQGLQYAFDWSAQLAAQGTVITSGMALGIDGAAHQGALSASGRTIAVVAHGLDQTYPKRHSQLKQQIIASGAVVSEFALGVQPKREYFPRRNRIISGLSEAVLVVEAAQKSGTLITARYAIEQNREVFAICGAINNPNAQGCNHLIQQGAYLADSPDYIAQVLGWRYVAAGDMQTEELPELLEKMPFEPTHFDELASVFAMDSQALLSKLLEWELAGLIVNEAGSYYRL